MRLDCRQRKAMLLTSVLRRQNMDFAGAGVPAGTPPFNGARYLDTTTGVIWLGRNVLNFNGSAHIILPTFTNARKLRYSYKLDSIPATNSTPYNPSRSYVVGTTGIWARSGTWNGTQNGSPITYNITPAIIGAWTQIEQQSATDQTTSQISITTAGQKWAGLLCDFQILGAGDVLLANYAIDEGSGTTIIDSVSGQNGTLTLGSGSWQLEWVPQN